MSISKICKFLRKWRQALNIITIFFRTLAKSFLQFLKAIIFQKVLKLTINLQEITLKKAF